MLSRVSFFPSCAASLYAVWGGGHMVCAISLALTGDFKVSFTKKKKITAENTSPTFLVVGNWQPLTIVL
jgi:hypothetical protein